MGYQGFAKFYADGSLTTPLVILCTSASVNMVLEKIYSQAVLGMGWFNAATSSHYADDALRFEGNIDFDLQGTDAIWDFMIDWLIYSRAYPRSLDISPDGARVYQYHTTGAYDANYDLNGAWNTSAAFSTSQGSFVTVSAGVVALDRVEVDPAGGTNFTAYSYINQKTGVIAGDCTVFGGTNPLNPGGGNISPIPYWRTNAQLLRGTYTAPFTGGTVPQAGLETVEWSVDLTQNQIVLYTCNGDRLPTALLQGPIEATGNVTLYNEDGVFDPIFGPDQEGTLTEPYLYAENTWFRVEISRNSPSSSLYIELPAVVVESDDYSIQGQDSITNRAFSLKGLGGRCDGGSPSNVVMPPMIMSNSSGAYPGP